MKILITGGHLTPALSYIDWVKKNQPKDKLVFAGRDFSQDKLQQKAVEKYEVEKRNVSFISFSAVRFGKSFFSHILTEAPLFLKSIIKAKKILKNQKTMVVVSFGGYVAVPFVLAAFLLKIPVVTHEQTMVAGFANTIIGFFAKKIAVSFEDTASEFPEDKVVVTGNLLRSGVFSSRHQKPAWFKNNSDKPILLIMGGNQGSQAINEIILESLPELVQNWTVVHQCGKPTKERNYKLVLETAKSHLSTKYQDSYFVTEWIDGRDLFWLYRNSIAAVSRSGANATQELAVAGLPTIFVPLPMAHKNEQHKNAQWLVNIGGAILIDQAGLDSESLSIALDKIKTFQKPMKEALSKLSFSKDAAKKFYEITKEVTLKS
ncbi:MAG: UDP-N-acetylglucosamine--N-acetylmuramyl-(pentapeptide) pyrophosphoryl-undecaprenol N-acetylglucosamine transferase [Candidatus Pacebacteria bacterium]|jgi:UDP-N-acetylglucosamine--N-acetylmuramyl-(pentapeptide) pyrophosphoryl-undecaprenol N-acetylglucosamine transferase|nr:UDP-N-acetylglucosamine--N-acetylmuramyl-(pentapeptide) pyrophosphoryl-undecaprenol N-acetylglucosamine transferase [Candidatus Paceibacterota bacterium]MBT4652097.1 UDP-N-acetylglucosamine--N-acetylmuramyl-(pentapeptide) pyrophosphoryl-undecaprenol N-acetylglucosamine transferase [Candidatus Paceibacterota bacterium]MBT6756119.1 UDP-N-acetylglucosamine--N-acetylmuramyl-(pentapeptide) pyrophosphoryl-undecaprenol N-acetylglucosamine transferase [Candidatus Paceibacterota bacterium]MBT6921712.1